MNESEGRAADEVGYRTIAGEAQGQIEIKRSIFLARVVRTGSEDAARAVIDRARAEHPQARHHCTAMVLGPQGRLERSNDDGEPAGTAGAPMLEVLRGAQLSDVVAVVTRWFGGTLLGAGGLVRAYSDSLRAAVEQARIVRREPRAEYVLRLSHAEAGRVENDLRSRQVHVLGAEYAAEVTLQLAVAPEEEGALEALLGELTGGRPDLRRTGQSWVDVPV